MIDTIVLVLSEGFTIMEPDRFQPTARDLLHNDEYMGGRGYKICKQNPTRPEQLNGSYKPRLTLTKRYTNGGFGLSLKIELSLPKLIYGNNFDELTDDDFEQIVSKLQSALKQMGVLIFSEVLRASPVSAIHYSKNVVFTDGRIAKYWIDRLEEANIRKSLDTSKDSYQNGGSMFKTHASSFEVAFYDKIRELEASSKSIRRAERVDDVIQLGLFEQFQSRKMFEVFRMEVRLNTRRKIKATLKKVKVFTEPTFENLFKQEYSTKVLLHLLDEIREKRPAIFDFKKSSGKKFLTEMQLANPDIGMAQLLKICGLKSLSDEIGMRELRVMLSKLSDRSWYRLVADMRKVTYPNRVDPLLELRQRIERDDPVHLVDYKEYLLNNDKNGIN